ncbi:MAG: hypothetical protein RSC11_04710 [Mucinivorans sp.]
MKRIIFATLLFGVVSLVSAKNQSQIAIDNLVIDNSSGTLTVSFTTQTDKRVLNGNERLTLVPILYNGAQSMELTPIVISTRRAEIMDFRHRTMLPDSYIKTRTGTVLEYETQVPFQGWMNGASLRLDRAVDGCSRQVQLPSIVLAKNLKLVTEEYRFQPTFAYIVPSVEMVKNRNEKGSAHLVFEVGRSTLLPDFAGNTDELAKIAQTVDLVHKDANVTMRNITLWGTCSPEGSFKSNAILAQDRTNTVRAFIQSRYGYPLSVFVVSSEPEDWQGLVAAVEADVNVPSRQAVLDVLRSDLAPDVKDRQVAALDRGVPYRYMLKNLYPALRRVNYTINYQVKGFDLAQSKEVLLSRPGNLSLNEMYLIARSYEEGSPDFNNIFTTAAKIFPDDPTAIINAATSALQRGETQVAENYLMRIKGSTVPEYLNTAGVIMALSGDYDIAENIFRAAAASGLKAAKANLAHLARRNQQ